MNRGIVVNQTAKHLIVMTPDGVFDKIPKEGRECRIGEEIMFPARRGRRHARLFAVVSTMAAAAILSFVFVTWLSGVFPPGRVVAYITVDINPSVEMGIDADQNVIELRGLNTEGMQLVEQLDYKGKKIADVTGGLIRRAEEQGYLASGPAEIVVTSTVVKPTVSVDENALIENLKQTVDNHIQENHPQQAREYRVTTISAPVELREQAQKSGLSTGKYAIYLSAKYSGHSISIEQLKNEPISSLAGKNIPLETILQQDQLLSKEEWKRLLKKESENLTDQNGSGQQLAAQVFKNDSAGDSENENEESANGKRNADQDNYGRKNNENNDEEKRNRYSQNRDRDRDQNAGNGKEWTGQDDRFKHDGDKKRNNVRSRDNDDTSRNTRGTKRGNEFSNSVDKGFSQGGRQGTGRGEQNHGYDRQNERNSQEKNNTAREDTNRREARSGNEEKSRQGQYFGRDGKNGAGADQVRNGSGQNRGQQDAGGADREGGGGDGANPADKDSDKKNSGETDQRVRDQSTSSSDEGRQKSSGGSERNDGRKLQKMHIPFLNPYSLW